MIRKLGKLWRPDVFQGTHKKGNSGTYFEGWFYKVVSSDGKNAYAFIPGIYISPEPKDSHSFVMVLDAATHLSTFHAYTIDEFQSSSKKLDIRVGPNHFCADYFDLHIDSEKRTVHGRIHLGQLNPWPVTFFSPGVMGWYTFMPFMECYHGVISFDHRVSGHLSINDQTAHFENGRGYIEKDWGKSFPSGYVWMQSNHFSTPGVSLMASVANIPWLRSSFRGFIIGLWMNGRLLRFTTYTGAVLDRCQITEKDVRLIVRDKRHKLIIETERTSGAILHAPYDLAMTPKVSETLGSTIKIDLYERVDLDEELVFSESGEHAGLDVNGNLSGIVS